jgi:hypothetical protein
MVSEFQVSSVLLRIRDALNAAGVPYMLTGSFASSLHGTPRVTHDIDVVIAPVLGTLKALLRQFPDDRYYVSQDAALQAYGSEGMFNLVDFASGWKVDFIVRKSRPFSLEEFERRREEELDGISVFVASAEDVVVAKLEWAKLGESERQLRDAAGILMSRMDELDFNYVENWAKQLGLVRQWEHVKELAVSSQDDQRQ